MASKGRGRNSQRRTTITEPADVGLQTGDTIEFTASLPGSDGCIKIHGDGGARLTLDIPDNQLPAALHMVKMRHTAFDVTIRPRIGAIPESERPETVVPNTMSSSPL